MRTTDANLDSLLGLCGLHGRLLGYSFEDWDDDKQQEAKQFAEAFDGSGSLVFHSKVYGSGKTWAGCSILRRWILKDFTDRPAGYKVDSHTGRIWPITMDDNGISYRNTGPSALFVDMPNVLCQIRATYPVQGRMVDPTMVETEASIVGRLQAVGLLVMDDVGTQPPTDRQFEPRITHAIVNYRYNAQLPTIITTNKSGAELLDVLWGATVSRLQQMAEFVHLEEIDYRLKR